MKESFYSGWSTFSASATQSGALKPEQHEAPAGEPIDGGAGGGGGNGAGGGGGGGGSEGVAPEPRWQAPPIFDTGAVLASAAQKKSSQQGEESATDGGHGEADPSNSGFTTVAPPPAPSSGSSGYSSYLSGMSAKLPSVGSLSSIPSVGSLGSMKLSVSMEDMSASLGYVRHYIFPYTYAQRIPSK